MRVSTGSGSLRVMTTRGFFLPAIVSSNPDLVETSLTKTGETENRSRRAASCNKRCRRRQRKRGAEADGARACKGTKVSGFASLRLALGAAFLGALLHSPHAAAQQLPPRLRRAVTLGPSGLPLPRFVSLKSGRVNSRIGPGVNYSVDWMYTEGRACRWKSSRNIDNWRRVRDADGSEGWINQSLLSGRRTAIVAPWQRGKEAESTCSTMPTRMPASSPSSSRASWARSKPATANGAR